jgi:hypothetical protein
MIRRLPASGNALSHELIKGIALFQRGLGRNQYRFSIFHDLRRSRESCTLESKSIYQLVNKEDPQCNANIYPTILVMKEEKDKCRSM